MKASASKRSVNIREQPPVIYIKPIRRWSSLNLRELWPYRELIYFLIWRDVKVRHKQTAIGAAWAIVQPLVTMILFTLVFSRLARVPSDGLPYPIFVYTALLPWNLFAGALQRATTSLVSSSNLISKVYFPRLIVPFSATISGLVEFAIGFALLLAMMIWYGRMPSWAVLSLPLFIILALAAALAIGIWLSALNVRYRDVGHAIPFLIQTWLFASPVAYPVAVIPGKWRFLYGLNPMVGVIEGFRWALLAKPHPDFQVISLSTALVAIIMIGGLLYFKRLEQTFADVV